MKKFSWMYLLFVVCLCTMGCEDSLGTYQFTFDADGKCYLVGMTSISQDVFEEKVQGYGWRTVATHKIHSDGTYDKEDFYDFPRSKALIELNDIFKKSYELKEGTLTKEKYNELCDFANGIENEKYKQAFLARLEQYSKFMEGNPAIDLELMKLDDSKGKLSDYKGKVMYIDFWATWCGPCMEEMPYFNELSIKYPNIQFIGISVYDDVKAWKNRISNGDYGNVIEVFSKDPKINSGWNVTGIPRFLLIDENFNIISSDAPRPSQKDKIELLLEKYNNK